MKEIVLLGATGSIGTQVLEVIKNNENFSLKGISFGKNIKRAIEIIENYKPEFVCALEESDMEILKEKYPNIQFFYGSVGLIDLVEVALENGIVINAIVGIAGLVPTVKAIEAKKDILLANKETLVVAGDIINKLVEENGVKLIPIDSEHSAILQCINSSKREDVKKIIITASGGAFRDKTRKELENVTLEEATEHPNWSMGKKITIDSSTMVNKGLEVIEAHYLFKIDYSNIETVIHKESIIHSLVEFNDGSVIAQMGNPDMRLPIAYALNYPNHEINNFIKPLDLVKIGTLTFKEMNYERFPMVKLAYEVGTLGGILPLVYNVANEVAVKLFMEGKIKYLDIEKIIKKTVEYFKDKNMLNPSLEVILLFEGLVKEKILENYEV